MIINLAKERLDKKKLISWLKQVKQELARQNIWPRHGNTVREINQLEINLVFVSEREILALNRSFRKQDRVTDILSFYLGSSKSSLSFLPKRFILSGIEQSKDPCAQIYGELVLCLPVIKQKAKELAFPDWLYYLIVHGVLHLYGFQHESSKIEARQMYRIQDKVFKKLSSKNVKKRKIK